MVSRMAFGRPGRLKSSDSPQSTHLSGENGRRYEGEGNASHLFAEPGIIRSQTASVASGVMSRGAGPVPPVVTTTWQPSPSTSSMRAASTARRSSYTPIEGRPRALDASWKNPRMAGLLRRHILLGWLGHNRYNTQTYRVANVAVYPRKRGAGLHAFTYWSPYLATMSAWKLSSSVSSKSSVWRRILVERMWSTAMRMNTPMTSGMKTSSLYWCMNFTMPSAV